jgi:hypothetical protein
MNAIALRKTKGLNKTQIEHALKDCFYLTEQPAKVQECFASIQLRYWSGKHVIQEMKNGIIHNMYLNFQVQFLCGLSRGQILAADLNTQYALSFRVPKEEYKMMNYVLIRSTAFQPAITLS